MVQIALCRPYNNEDKINIRCPKMTRMPFIIFIISSVIALPSFPTPCCRKV